MYLRYMPSQAVWRGRVEALCIGPDKSSICSGYRKTISDWEKASCKYCFINKHSSLISWDHLILLICCCCLI